MLEIKITAKELAEAINNLAAALSVKDQQLPPVNDLVNRSATPTPALNPTVPQPAVTSAPQTTPQPVTPPQQPAIVPTAAPKYTFDMLSQAGAALVDAGKMEQLLAVLRKYNTQSLTTLAPEQYGAVANDLRALGAAI